MIIDTSGPYVTRISVQPDPLSLGTYVNFRADLSDGTWLVDRFYAPEDAPDRDVYMYGQFLKRVREKLAKLESEKAK